MPLDNDVKKRLRGAVELKLKGLVDLYKHFHAHPELSGREEATALRVAAELTAAGLEVTTGIGGHGVVGILTNGPGPTVLIRGDMDALPIEEATGLDYASKAKGRTEAGDEAPVMHACGHDAHTANLVGTAGLLAELRDCWRGTLLAVAQPAEEAIGGARLMLADGLYDRFPRPDFALATHVRPDLAAGTLSLCQSYVTAGADSLDLTIRGQGGHGATPHKTKDPIVLAAQTVLAFQTIVSREIDPANMGVITVGSISGGFQRNIVPEEVRLQLTIRCYDSDTRNRIIEAITRVTNGLALAAGIPEERRPIISRVGHFTPGVYNDPALVDRLTETFYQALGRDKVFPGEPLTGSEDFSRFGLGDPPIPLSLFFLGATSPERLELAAKGETIIPALHTPEFRLEPEETLRTGLIAMSSAVIELMDPNPERSQLA